MRNRVTLAVVALMACLGTSAGASAPDDMIIADQFNNRIIEINPQHQIVWSFGSGNPSLCNPGPHSIIGPNDEERIGSLTLMAGTGVPPNTIPQMPKGCVDNRVIEVDSDGNIVWHMARRA